MVTAFCTLFFYFELKINNILFELLLNTEILNEKYHTVPIESL